MLNRPACGSRLPPSAEAIENGLHFLTMDGRAVFKWAVRILTDSSQAVLDQAEKKVGDVRWFVPHQANIRIINAASDVLGFSRDSVFKNLDRYGNTSGGSIPLLLDEMIRGGQCGAATCFWFPVLEWALPGGRRFGVGDAESGRDRPFKEARCTFKIQTRRCEMQDLREVEEKKRIITAEDAECAENGIQEI